MCFPRRGWVRFVDSMSPRTELSGLSRAEMEALVVRLLGELTELKQVPLGWREDYAGIEAQMYWLGPNEVHCAACAIPRGIPPIQ